ncbi:MAG TPA: inositol monophosphatase family protein [Gemmatimonadales bacterium]|nr:inositol monophosphatase family protein [Gemmatimonadales bacterium]
MLSSKDLLRLAEAAARAAAGFLRSAPRPAAEQWEAKGMNDFVTGVDRRAEEIIAHHLLTAEPGAVVVGEELTPGAPVPSGLAWIVDPLDGTTNYLHDYPWYAVSIAAAVDGRLAAGVVLDVARDQCYAASRGGGTWLGGGRLQASAVAAPAHALVGTGFPFKHPELLGDWTRQFDRIARETSGIRRAGSAALDLADVAAGRFDGFWELRLAPWDYAAGQLLVEEAGGVVTDLAGRDPALGHGGIVAGNRAIHEWLLRVVGSERLGSAGVG